MYPPVTPRRPEGLRPVGLIVLVYPKHTSRLVEPRIRWLVAREGGSRRGVMQSVAGDKNKCRGFDPVRLAFLLDNKVARGDKRKYYRFRATRFYGGIATGDVVGCNLRCVFCWSGRARYDTRMGFWVSASEAFDKLRAIAQRKGYRRVRLSGGEPTIGREHLLSLLDYVDNARLLFILETNGILLGASKNYVEALRDYNYLHVRVSIKACSEELFCRLTLAKPEAFKLQLKAVEHLVSEEISFHVALLVSFGDDKCWASLLDKLASIIGPNKLPELIEIEVVKLYPSVRKMLKRYGIWPRLYEGGAS